MEKLESMTIEKLKQLSSKKKIKVKRQDGKQGPPLKKDYISALTKKDKSYEHLAVAELKKLVKKKGLTVNRLDGKKGNPLKSDYIYVLTNKTPNSIKTPKKSSDFTRRENRNLNFTKDSNLVSKSEKIVAKIIDVKYKELHKQLNDISQDLKSEINFFVRLAWFDNILTQSCFNKEEASGLISWITNLIWLFIKYNLFPRFNYPDFEIRFPRDIWIDYNKKKNQYEFQKQSYATPFFTKLKNSYKFDKILVLPIGEVIKSTKKNNYSHHAITVIIDPIKKQYVLLDSNGSNGDPANAALIFHIMNSLTEIDFPEWKWVRYPKKPFQSTDKACGLWSIWLGLIYLINEKCLHEDRPMAMHAFQTTYHIAYNVYHCLKNSDPDIENKRWIDVLTSNILECNNVDIIKREFEEHLC